MEIFAVLALVLAFAGAVALHALIIKAFGEVAENAQENGRFLGVGGAPAAIGGARVIDFHAPAATNDRRIAA